MILWSRPADLDRREGVLYPAVPLLLIKSACTCALCGKVGSEWGRLPRTVLLDAVAEVLDEEVARTVSYSMDCTRSRTVFRKEVHFRPALRSRMVRCFKTLLLIFINSFLAPQSCPDSCVLGELQFVFGRGSRSCAARGVQIADVFNVSVQLQGLLATADNVVVAVAGEGAERDSI